MAFSRFSENRLTKEGDWTPVTYVFVHCAALDLALGLTIPPTLIVRADEVIE